jgi:hypothetical protein
MPGTALRAVGSGTIGSFRSEYEYEYEYEYDYEYEYEI